MRETWIFFFWSVDEMPRQLGGRRSLDSPQACLAGKLPPSPRCVYVSAEALNPNPLPPSSQLPGFEFVEHPGTRRLDDATRDLQQLGFLDKDPVV